MATIYQNLTDLIGKTPLLKLNKYGKKAGAEVVLGY
jgi:cysteine synthase